MRTIRLALLLALLASAVGQNRLVTVELGIAGEITPDAWNPLRVTLRDQLPVEFSLHIDRGSLREGPRIVSYHAELAGGGGIRVFEDEVYLPAWRNMSWQMRSEEAVLASGGFERSRSDIGPLQLVVAGSLGAHRELLEPDLRALDVLPGELPERLAAYDGVATVIIDPSAAPPRAEAVVSAAAAGAVVVLLEPLPASHRSLAGLAPQPLQRLGAGWLVRAPDEEVSAYLAELGRLDLDALALALITPEMRSGPEAAPLVTLSLIIGLYSLAVSALVRLAGMPGFIASLALAVIVSLTAYGTLRPEEAEAMRSRQLVLGGGPLAFRQAVQTFFSLAEAPRRFEPSGRALDDVLWQASETAVSLDLGRWQSAAVAHRPSLQEASLRWREGRLINASPHELTDVYVLGLGSQPRLGASATLEPSPGEDLVPDAYAALIPLLPEGTALARRGGQVHAALPEPPRRLAGLLASAQRGLP